MYGGGFQFYLKIQGKAIECIMFFKQFCMAEALQHQKL